MCDYDGVQNRYRNCTTSMLSSLEIEIEIERKGDGEEGGREREEKGER